MNTPLNEVIESASARKVAGDFQSRRDLEMTVEALLLDGFNRADIDALSNLGEAVKSAGPVDAAAAEQPEIPRGSSVILSEDVAASMVVIGGTLGTICAVAAVYGVVASGGGSGLAVLAALLAGAAGAGIGYIVTPRLSGNERKGSSEGPMAGQVFTLWVRVWSPDSQGKAQQILREHGATAIRVREIEIDKRAEDIPLSSLRPDPWLGDDRLGQP